MGMMMIMMMIGLCVLWDFVWSSTTATATATASGWEFLAPCKQIYRLLFSSNAEESVTVRNGKREARAMLLILGT